MIQILYDYETIFIKFFSSLIIPRLVLLLNFFFSTLFLIYKKNETLFDDDDELKFRWLPRIEMSVTRIYSKPNFAWDFACQLPVNRCCYLSSRFHRIRHQSSVIGISLLHTSNNCLSFVHSPPMVIPQLHTPSLDSPSILLHFEQNSFRISSGQCFHQIPNLSSWQSSHISEFKRT